MHDLDHGHVGDWFGSGHRHVGHNWRCIDQRHSVGVCGRDGHNKRSSDDFWDASRYAERWDGFYWLGECDWDIGDYWRRDDKRYAERHRLWHCDSSRDCSGQQRVGYFGHQWRGLNIWHANGHYFWHCNGLPHHDKPDGDCGGCRGWARGHARGGRGRSNQCSHYDKSSQSGRAGGQFGEFDRNDRSDGAVGGRSCRQTDCDAIRQPREFHQRSDAGNQWNADKYAIRVAWRQSEKLRHQPECNEFGKYRDRSKLEGWNERNIYFFCLRRHSDGRKLANDIPNTVTTANGWDSSQLLQCQHGCERNNQRARIQGRLTARGNEP